MKGYYKLQMKNDSTKVNHVDEVIADNRITSHIDYAGPGFENLNKGDIVLVHKGSYPHSLVEVLYKISDENEISGTSFGIDYRVDVKSLFSELDNTLDFKKQNKQIGYDGTFNPLYDNTSKTFLFIKSWYDYIEKKNYISELKKIIFYKKQIILQGPPGTGKTRKAKIIAKEILGLSSVKDIENNEQFKLVQFHSGYMYDDFVRGIIAKPDEEKDEIVFEAENKILGKFAESANNNYIKSRIDNTVSPAKSNLQRFRDYVILKLDESPENKFFISKNVYIFHVDDYRFKYKGDNWTTHSHGLNMNFSELEKIITYGFKGRIEINKSALLNSLTRSHATYFANVLDQYNSFLKSESENSYEPLNNYVLIIDEINRANLSSVLGELIYALEYRAETVESMYEVGGSRELVLPPNLYIIGTMNTADRSVGHIDYAIRRRFAFVDILPKNLTTELGNDFKQDIFTKVSELFIENYNPAMEYGPEESRLNRSKHLSEEFEPKDVWLGHSYFIQHYEQDENGIKDESKRVDFTLRLEYEIKPILREYVKDGILKPSALDTIENLGK